MTEQSASKWITLQLDELTNTVQTFMDVVEDRSGKTPDEVVDIAIRNYMICHALDQTLQHIFTLSTVIEEKVDRWLESRHPELQKEYKQRIRDYHDSKTKVQEFINQYQQSEFNNEENINE